MRVCNVHPSSATVWKPPVLLINTTCDYSEVYDVQYINMIVQDLGSSVYLRDGEVFSVDFTATPRKTANILWMFGKKKSKGPLTGLLRSQPHLTVFISGQSFSQFMEMTPVSSRHLHVELFVVRWNRVGHWLNPVRAATHFFVHLHCNSFWCTSVSSPANWIFIGSGERERQELCQKGQVTFLLRVQLQNYKTCF